MRKSGRVTSHDVARAAGVSQATVSRVLQDSAHVAPETRQRVLKALDETGYVPDLVARAMRTHRTGTIGVLVASLTNPFYPELIEALGGHLSEADCRMVLWSTAGAGEASALAAIREGLVDGLIFTTVTGDSRPLAEALRRRAPIVLVNRGLEELDCDQVATDNVAGGAMIARYFLRWDHRLLACIGGPKQASTAVEREVGFRRALQEDGGLLVRPRLAHPRFSHAYGQQAAQELLRSERRPTALFCVNDLMALGAIDGARSLGLRIPEDVWIVGYDDIELASWESYSLTTVSQPIDVMAEQAVSLLISRIDSPASPSQRVRLPSRLVVRRSTEEREFVRE